MNIKLLISAAAIALVAGLGSASADEEFATLNGISPPGSHVHFSRAPIRTCDPGGEPLDGVAPALGKRPPDGK